MATPVPKNPKLYKTIVREASKKFKSPSGIYRSAWIVREYLKRGGKYKTKSKPKSSSPGLRRWFREEWVDVTTGQKCGSRSTKKYPVCRPTKRISKKTPRTVSEISKKSLKRAIRKKQHLREKGNIQFGRGKIADEYKLFLEDLKKYEMEETDKILQTETDIPIKLQKLQELKNHIKQLKEQKQEEKRQKKEQLKKEFYKKKKEIKKRIEMESAALLKKEQDSQLQTVLQAPDQGPELEPELIQDGGRAQYRGRRSKVMVKVPKNVKKWAKYFFVLKKKGFQGAIETGNKRAKQLATKDTIPIEDVRYMRNWFARHVYTSYPTFKEWNKAGRPKGKEWHHRRGIQAWNSWGGNSGFRWVNSNKIIKQLNDYFGTDYNKIEKKIT
jgi:hypothetical protein